MCRSVEASKRSPPGPSGQVQGWAAVVENGPRKYSYPSLVTAGDNRVHLVYTRNRECIDCVAVEPP